MLTDPDVYSFDIGKIISIAWPNARITDYAWVQVSQQLIDNAASGMDLWQHAAEFVCSRLINTAPQPNAGRYDYSFHLTRCTADIVRTLLDDPDWPADQNLVIGIRLAETS